jgi:hypothetical protein
MDNPLLRIISDSGLYARAGGRERRTRDVNYVAPKGMRRRIAG